MNFDLLVEGPTDEAVGRRILAATGHSSGTCFGRRGCKFIERSVGGYAQRARFGWPLLVLVDFMDFDYACPPTCANGLLEERPSLLLLNVVVRELESWLIADREGIAEFLGVSLALVPRDPENIPDPKQTLVNLARRARRRSVRDALVPPDGMSAVTGPGYSIELQRFVQQSWDPGRARTMSRSLMRCLSRLEAWPDAEG